MTEVPLPITEDWLKAHGFKWHQLDRQNDKHWLLWIGGGIDDRMTCYEDLGVEVAPTMSGEWFCWLRADSGGRYSRFLHIRHLRAAHELTALISAMIGYPFDPANTSGGALRTPARAAIVAKLQERFDQKLLTARTPHGTWRDKEKDEFIGGPLHEHQQAYLDARSGKP